ncbi:MAG: SGNH/GDSL hydrolase family protein, partial [Betaproteobacteria bacterium]|nr:SGNH/GDSL hydrolase family protein [Betaproteobacteria bacterium]
MCFQTKFAVTISYAWLLCALAGQVAHATQATSPASVARGAAAPRDPGGLRMAVPALDSLRSPDGPLSPAQIYSARPDAVKQAVELSADPAAARALAQLQRSASAPARLDAPSTQPGRMLSEGPSPSYTYLYCYATASLRQGERQLPLDAAPGEGRYLGVWATHADGSGYVQVPIEVPPYGSSSLLSSHLVYYTTRYTPAELEQMCKVSLLAQARQLQQSQYPGASGTLELGHIVARGRNNSLSLDHPFLPGPAGVGDGRIHTIVSLGDSLSDTDSTSNLLYHYVPHRSTWFAGHFTNGWVWTEYAAHDLGVHPYNEAWGGAGSQTQPVVDWFPGSTWLARVGYGLRLPSIELQSQLYGEHVSGVLPRAPDETLYTLMIGGNDFIGYDETPETVLAAVGETVRKLITQSGARNIVIMNLPDISVAPILNAGPRSVIKQRVQARLDAYEAQLPVLVAQLVAQYPQAHLTLFDTRAAFDAVLKDPAAHGFIDAARSCLVDPSETYASPAPLRPGC